MRYWDPPVNEELPAAAAVVSLLLSWPWVLLVESSTSMKPHQHGIHRQFPETGEFPGKWTPGLQKGVKLLSCGQRWLVVLQSCMCVILTWGEVISLEFLYRTVKVFICERCDLERSLAQELISDITRSQLFSEASQNCHYQNWKVLFWQRNNFCVRWLSTLGNYPATL